MDKFINVKLVLSVYPKLMSHEMCPLKRKIWRARPILDIKAKQKRYQKMCCFYAE